MHDIVIIGGGPAGISAGITARARNKDVLIISNSIEDNPLAASSLVENYPGMPGATGKEILATMQTQAQELGVQFLTARAISVIPLGKSFSVATSSDYVEALTIILAPGTASNVKFLEGELSYLGRGVSYCATCDGMLYRAASVLVVGLSPAAVEEANFMAEIGATVHYISQREPEGLDESICFHKGEVLSVEGDNQKVTSVLIAETPAGEQEKPEGEAAAKAAANDKRKATKLEVKGVFILRPGIAPANLLSTLEMESRFIKVDANMCTNVKGVFAAGDCTGKPLQIAKAVGQGQTAVLSAVDYLYKTKSQ